MSFRRRTLTILLCEWSASISRLMRVYFINLNIILSHRFPMQPAVCLYVHLPCNSSCDSITACYVFREREPCCNGGRSKSQVGWLSRLDTVRECDRQIDRRNRRRTHRTCVQLLACNVSRGKTPRVTLIITCKWDNRKCYFIKYNTAVTSRTDHTVKKRSQVK